MSHSAWKKIHSTRRIDRRSKKDSSAFAIDRRLLLIGDLKKTRRRLLSIGDLKKDSSAFAIDYAVTLGLPLDHEFIIKS